MTHDQFLALNHGMTEMAPVACWSWDMRFMEERQPVRGARCVYCGVDIALPMQCKSRLPACFGCSLDRGIIPAEEIEP